jgi:O-antigen/teichoic acid export membrane protein
LLLLGASAYVVLGLAGHSLSPRDYASLGSLYLLTAIVGPGVFAAVEQETNREVAGRLARGVGTAAVRRGGALVGLGLAGVVTVGLLALSPILVPRVLGGSWTLLAASVIAVIGSAAVYLLRGVFGGEQRYRWYAVSLGAEGMGRIVPCGVLALVGTTSAGAFGLAFAIGTGLAAALCVPGLRRTPGAVESPPADVRRMASGTGLLALASALTFVVANTAPLVLTAKLPAQPELAASFVSLFVLARIPTFLFAPVQAFLLPGLTAAAHRGDVAHLRSNLRLALLATAGLGLAGAAAGALLGPWAARTFFNAPLDLPGSAAGLLGLSTVAMMAAQVLQPALVALGRHRVATAGWIAGTAVFAALLFLPIDPVAGAVAAQLAGPLVVVVVMATAVATALRGLRQPV